jgi:hypothetical protein
MIAQHAVDHPSKGLVWCVGVWNETYTYTSARDARYDKRWPGPVVCLTALPRLAKRRGCACWRPTREAVHPLDGGDADP